MRCRESTEPPHQGRQGRQFGELGDLSVELFAPLQFVHQERVILAEDEPIVEPRRDPPRPLNCRESALLPVP